MTGEVRVQAVALSVTRPSGLAGQLRPGEVRQQSPCTGTAHSARAHVAAARSCPCTCRVSVQNRESRAAYGASGLRRPCGSPGRCADCIQDAGKHSVQVIMGHEHCTFMLSLGK